MSKFDVQYEPRGPIKGQVYVNFMVELSSVAAKQEAAYFQWVLSVDGSSNKQGSGVGVILEGPNGLLIDQALHFAFKASNNHAEYEALVTSMLLAKEMGEYLKYVKILRETFVVFELIHVPESRMPELTC